MKRTSVAAAALTVLALGWPLAACGGGEDNATRSGRSGTPSAASWVGLRKQEAIARAEASDTPWRITREDDESFLVTQDFVEDRINFEVDDGKVTKATYG
jgi:hypothetical protein